MFGTLRLVLALLVLMSHLGLTRRPDLGTAAVAVFFLLSGYVMAASVARNYPRAGDYGVFVADRALRIFPQYLLWLSLSVAYAAVLAPGWAPVGARPLAENAALLPLMWGAFDFRPWLTGVRYIAPAWSLSLEFYFYLLLPPLALGPRLGRLAMGASLAIFAAAALGWIEPAVWGYRFLPGVLFVFLVGARLWERRSLPAAPIAAVLATAAAAWAAGTLGRHWTLEVVGGLVAGSPLVLLLGRLTPRPLDTLLGNLSYGVFLNHSLVLAALWRRYPHLSGWVAFASAGAVSILAAAAGHWIAERPFIRLRRRLRRPAAAAAGAPA